MVLASMIEKLLTPLIGFVRGDRNEEIQDMDMVDLMCRVEKHKPNFDEVFEDIHSEFTKALTESIKDRKLEELRGVVKPTKLSHLETYLEALNIIVD